jgi:hypothetical protein
MSGDSLCPGIPSSNPSSPFSPMLVFSGDYLFYLVMTWTQPSFKKDFMCLKKIKHTANRTSKIKAEFKNWLKFLVENGYSHSLCFLSCLLHASFATPHTGEGN